MGSELKSNAELCSLISQAMLITNSIYDRLKIEVDSILNSAIKDQAKIENILEQLLNICDRDDATALYKKLCKYYYYINPEVTARYIYLYRDIWDN